MIYGLHTKPDGTKCDNKCRTCNDYKCRCADCFCLEDDGNGTWICGTHDVPCEKVDTCYEYEE